MRPAKQSDGRIQRTFADLREDEVFDVDRALMRGRIGQPGAISWERLLKSRRILIISEAGAGKTYECKAQQQLLWSMGEPAFYLELSSLATSNPKELLTVAEERRFDEWTVHGTDIATFFLDSIDELKLTLGSFENALRRLSKALYGRLAQTRLVVTTRPNPIDEELITQYLDVADQPERARSDEAFADVVMGRNETGTVQHAKENFPHWRRVTLVGLSDGQIRQMALVQGIPDPEVLLADINARNAQDFARRPQDLIELCADWREHRRIRTHEEQVAHNIRVKLKPRTDRARPELAHLSAERAYEGASRLALAALLTRKLTIRFTVESDRGKESGAALDPDLILPDWTDAERKTLLERALFGFATYGRVRFHHRSVLEFLAAKRIEERIKHSMPIRSVKRLLFVDTAQHVLAIRPSMRAVAAWLACAHTSIFNEVLRREPQILFNEADHESLPISTRKQILQVFVRCYRQGTWRGLSISEIQVHRFATPELGETIQELWQIGIDNNEVRELLLKLIRFGRISHCADIAHVAAINFHAMHSERLEAIKALVSLEDSRLPALSQSMIDKPISWPSKLVGIAISWLLPTYVSASQICTILQNRELEGDSLDEYAWEWSRAVENLQFSEDYLTRLREGLTEMVIGGVSWAQQTPRPRSQREELIQLLAVVCLKLLEIGKRCAQLLYSTVVTLRLAPWEGGSNSSVELLQRKLNELDSSTRQSIFWANAKLSGDGLHYADPWKLFCSMDNWRVLAFSPTQDEAWMHRDLADAVLPMSKRAIVLYTLLQGAPNDQLGWQAYHKKLRQCTADQTELLAIIDERSAPVKQDPDITELEEQQALKRKTEEENEHLSWESWVSLRREILDDREAAFHQDRRDDTAWNMWQASRFAAGSNLASIWDRVFFEHHFDKDIADRLQLSLRTIWRNQNPRLRSERPAEEKHFMYVHWQFGMFAIDAEAECEGWAAKLSVEEACLAVRYSILDERALPLWLEALVAHHPSVVEQIIGAELYAELEEKWHAYTHGTLLEQINRDSPATVRRLIPHIAAWLNSHFSDVTNEADQSALSIPLEHVLRVLARHGEPQTLQEICTLAQTQLTANGQGALKCIWLSSLLQLHPSEGVKMLEQLLASIGNRSSELAIEIFGALFGPRRSTLRIDLRRPGFTPELLLRLVRLAYQHVRIADDPVREGTYTPDARDHAESGRNAIITTIIEYDSAQAWDVKMKMLDDPLFAHFRERLAMLSHEKAAQDADDTVLSETEVAKLDHYGEFPPKTRDDMFALLCDRLDDLEEKLLQDDSPSEVWALIQLEKQMRRVIAGFLKDRANQLYIVDQEAVTADEKETDIRLRALSGHEATIELKIGENWSGRQLRDTIGCQLVRQYMAPENSRSGCLLVTVSTDKTWKHPEDGHLMDVTALRVMLENEAERIEQEMGNCLRLNIRVLDLKPRLQADR